MTRNSKIRILFISSAPITDFIKIDLEILNRNFNVKSIKFVLDRKRVPDTLKTIFTLIVGILWADITFSWFADIHAFSGIKLSKIFRKKSIVIVGGYEVAKIPEIGYGALLDPKNAKIVKYVLNNADIVLTVENGLQKDAIQNAGVDAKNFRTVHTGYDDVMFIPKGVKEDLIITVSAGNNWRRVQLKGIDTFVESARYLSNIQFLVIGIEGEGLKKLHDIAPPNVKFIGQVNQEMLVPYYQRAKVYCQLSIREGLPNALCEAMLCECVPVGTNCRGIKTAIGDDGFYVPYGNIEATVEAIKLAIKSDKGKKSRDRIQKFFSSERREEELVQIIKKLSDKKV